MEIIKKVYRFLRHIFQRFIIKPFLYLIYLLGKLLGIWSGKPFYIVRIDGGISSQIDQYVIGQALFREKNQEYEILYDLTWYDQCGMDLNNVFVRNFDLMKLFPALPFREVSPMLRKIYYHCFRYDGAWREYKSIDVSDLPSAPLYLDGYGYLVSPKRLRQIYEEMIKPNLGSPEQILDARNFSMYKKIKQEKNSVAIQVRRGDMATAGFTSHPISTDYYFEAMQRAEFADAYFFFFSDEPQWVRDNIITSLDQNIKYELIDYNGSDKGYIDLYLCAACRHVISSQGSMGAKASMLGSIEGSVLVMPEFRYDKRIAEAFSYLDIVALCTDE